MSTHGNKVSTYRTEPYSDGFGDYWRIVGGKFDSAPNIVYCFSREDALAYIKEAYEEDRINAAISDGEP